MTKQPSTKKPAKAGSTPTAAPKKRGDKKAHTKPAKATGKKAAKRNIEKKATKDLVIEKIGHRPISLTQAKIDAICDHIHMGNFAVTACAIENVAESTFYYWLDVGRKDQLAGKASIHATLLESIKKASAIAESANVQLALQGGLGWQANMTWLERRFPDRWGQQSKLSLEEARSFVRKIMSVLAMHISDRTILEKIVNEVRNIEVEKNERIG